MAFVERAARVDVTVLLTGESGTGKEVLARALHARSPRGRGPIVSTNCAAIPRELCESELFGHERGAFTGALAAHAGRFERAHGGTLFLDEIGELPLEGQAKLLRVLEERKITRVGGTREIAVDVRIVAATNRDLHALVREGRFRADLLYRLAVAEVHIAPLRSRRDDIEPLARHFLALSDAAKKRGPLGFSAAAMERLRAHDWPGNVRELRNVVERASIFSQNPVIGPEALELGVAARGTPTPGDAAAPMEEVIQAQIERALRETGGNKKKAAEKLQISRSSLYNYMDRFKLR
jgi:DNA-binding NtrC family response regulator